MPITIGGGGSQIEIKDGTYPAVLESIETVPSPSATIAGDARRWTFLVEHDGKVEPLSVFSSMNTGPKTKAYAWLTALLGEAPKAGKTYEEPVGKRVLVKVVHKESGWPDVAEVLPYAEPQQTIEGLPR
jgi:hypothetical protein